MSLHRRESSFHQGCGVSVRPLSAECACLLMCGFVHLWAISLFEVKSLVLCMLASIMSYRGHQDAIMTERYGSMVEKREIESCLNRKKKSCPELLIVG